MYNIGNSNNLPEVLTCYSAFELNKFVSAGHKTVVEPIKRNRTLREKNLILRNKKTFEHVATDSRQILHQYTGKASEYSEEEWELIYKGTAYRRPRKQNDGWGAYILPKGIEDGQRVYVADLLEDIVATYFHGFPVAAEDGEGIWDGSNITIDMKPYDEIVIIG